MLGCGLQIRLIVAESYTCLPKSTRLTQTLHSGWLKGAVSLRSFCDDHPVGEVEGDEPSSGVQKLQTFGWFDC